ncbi:hypothetical protein [uncultured Thiodictyon sp.]|uniref:hypothetical protein n=1 Tax=uncultured Thiodictyon sp. TaxID=1846217 RepID=UPI0025D6E751|nr:hypothetical protein [uncultured Thiodictyon sp.]
MQDHSLSGLIELLLVVGLLFWFWSFQRAALRQDPGTDRGARQDCAAQNQGEPPAA